MNKKAVTLASLGGAAVVILAVFLLRQDLMEAYYLHQVTSDNRRFDELLRTGGKARHAALRRYLRTKAGQALLQERCEHLLTIVPKAYARDVFLHPESASHGALALCGEHIVRAHHSLNGYSLSFNCGPRGVFSDAAAFFAVLDELQGVKITLPSYSGLEVEILPAHQALRRSACYAYIENGSVTRLICIAPDADPPDDFTEAHREALGNLPALYYSRVDSEP